jgi:glutamine synthetase
MLRDRSALCEEAARFLEAHPETRYVDAIYADLCGVIRGKRYPAAELGKLARKGLAFPGAVFLLSVTGSTQDPKGHGFSDGDPDFQALLVPGSIKPVPWAEPATAQALVTLVEADGSPYAFEPRNVLARVAQRFAADGLTPVAAFELEFYLIDRERGPDGGPQPPVLPTTGQRDRATQVYGMNEIEAFSGLLDEMVRACGAQGVPVGAVSAEYAPGQYEINLMHGPDPLLAADQAVLFKRAVKGCARRHGLQATFAAKPYPEETGNGMHLHLSVLDREGRNLFDGGEVIASQSLRQAIGGALALMPDCMALFAPNPNSYRRYKANNFVPVSRSWGYENRSAAVRVPTGPADARRIEHRVAGADANPYLALAALLASLHHGITAKVDPGPPSQENAGTALDPEIPLRPFRALERLARSQLMKDYLGADYVEAYVATKWAEIESFYDEMGATEYAWYLQAD